MIDWEFISTLEGHRLTGYVPDVEGSQSGVTIADGVDLGQMSETVYQSLSAELRALLAPYIGLKRQDAVQALERQPLVITEAQSDVLNQTVRQPLIDNLRQHYDTTAREYFDTIADACQTVLASVTFQYGSPWVKCPKFWYAATDANWQAVVAELENFGDAYPTRRKKEAVYLASNLGLNV